MAKTITHFKYTYTRPSNDVRYTATMTDSDGENIQLVFVSSVEGTNTRKFVGCKSDESEFSPKTLSISVSDDEYIRNLNVYVSNDGETYYQVYFILAHQGEVILDIGSLIEYVEF